MMLTVTQDANRVKVSKQIVYALGGTSGIPSHRFDFGRGTIRITKEDLAEYIEVCREGATTERRRAVQAPMGGRTQ